MLNHNPTSNDPVMSPHVNLMKLRAKILKDKSQEQLNTNTSLLHLSTVKVPSPAR